MNWPPTVNCGDTDQPPSKQGSVEYPPPACRFATQTFVSGINAPAVAIVTESCKGGKMNPHVLEGIKPLTIFGHRPQHSLTQSSCQWRRIEVCDYIDDFFPDGHYDSPFQGVAYDYSDDETREHPRTVRFPFVSSRPCAGGSRGCQVVEMRMCALSNAIREKPNWWEKIKDPALAEKWRREALDQQEDEHHIHRLTEKMVNTPHFHPST